MYVLLEKNVEKAAQIPAINATKNLKTCVKKPN